MRREPNLEKKQPNSVYLAYGLKQPYPFNRYLQDAEIFRLFTVSYIFLGSRDPVKKLFRMMHFFSFVNLNRQVHETEFKYLENGI